MGADRSALDSERTQSERRRQPAGLLLAGLPEAAGPRAGGLVAACAMLGFLARTFFCSRVLPSEATNPSFISRPVDPHLAVTALAPAAPQVIDKEVKPVCRKITEHWRCEYSEACVPLGSLSQHANVKRVLLDHALPRRIDVSPFAMSADPSINYFIKVRASTCLLLQHATSAELGISAGASLLWLSQIGPGNLACPPNLISALDVSCRPRDLRCAGRTDGDALDVRGRDRPGRAALHTAHARPSRAHILELADVPTGAWLGSSAWLACVGLHARLQGMPCNVPLGLHEASRLAGRAVLLPTAE